MKILNLKTENKQEEIIKQYLENNVSDNLAEKINNGVKTQKDGKDLINKKDLKGFFKYATEEARKLAEKGANSAMVEDKVVFGWAVHYFEEDSLIGVLYNEDGSEYKPVVKKTTKPTTTVQKSTYVPPVKKPEPQMTLFDYLTPKVDEEKEQENTNAQPEPLEEYTTEDDIIDAIAEQEEEEEKPISPIYMKYLKIQIQYPEHVIAYRLGDFYEVFGDNAKKIADNLDLTLTGRDFGLEERVPMIGFPYHVSDNYFDKISKFSNLIIVDNDEVRHYEKPMKNFTIDMETGEVITPANNDELTQKIINFFGNKMEIRL